MSLGSHKIVIIKSVPYATLLKCHVYTIHIRNSIKLLQHWLSVTVKAQRICDWYCIELEQLKNKLLCVCISSKLLLGSCLLI